MQLIEIRIGRNIGDTPMTVDQWRAFVDEARAILDGVASGLERTGPLTQWTEIHRGVGTWTAADGSEVREDSAVVTLYTDATSLDLVDVDILLVDMLAELAGKFSQDAVALVWQGSSILVGATAVAK